jgi:hypothetical protein
MADVTVDAAAHANTLRGMRSLVFTHPDTGYFFFIDGDVDLKYTKTTNGGLTWGVPVAVSAADDIVAFDVWYDQWTPDIMSRDIHIWYFGITATDDASYKRLNTVNDTLSGLVTVNAETSAVAGRGIFISGARMRGGNLYCAYDIDAGAELYLARSTDNGATWSARTDVVEATLDQAWCYPGNEADPNDAWFVYYDASATAITLKVHDDSANTNTESATIQTQTAGVTDLTGQYPNAGAIRHSDGHLILASWSLRDNASGVFNVYDINGTGSVTTLTSLAASIDDCYYPSVFIDQRTDDIYIAYVGLTTGAETLDTTAGVYYAVSKDRGATWTQDIAYSATASDWRGCWTPLSGPRFLAIWQDISSIGLITNHENSKIVTGPMPNNYQFLGCGGVGNTGIISVTEKIR